jgi:hypothetical protein
MLKPFRTTGCTDRDSGYAAILADTGGVLYGTELGSVTLTRVGFFCFPIKHSTHTLDREFAASGNKLSRMRDRHYRCRLRVKKECFFCNV